MHESTNAVLSLGIASAASLSRLPMSDQEEIEKNAGEELRNLKMRGGYIAPKERRRLEERSGICQQEVEQLVAKPKVKRNAPCQCGSGKKQKKCCGV
jgi:uncharacterized protein YchJ|tara:strand:+ start:562 stop:852 length:291 start_codon:yes stop_codon:yes gene_type:complete